jgi:AcrR family transcriptional regulator
MLEQAMVELMRERDFSDISVQDITARADLNRATFYKHFFDKYDLLDTILVERFQGMMNDRLPGQSTLTAANLNILIQTSYDCLSGCYGYCQPMRVKTDHSALVLQVQQSIYGVLCDWLQDAAVRPKLRGSSPESLALAVSWMIAGPIVQVFIHRTQAPEPDMIKQLTRWVSATLGDLLPEN